LLLPLVHGENPVTGVWTVVALLYCLIIANIALFARKNFPDFKKAKLLRPDLEPESDSDLDSDSDSEDETDEKKNKKRKKKDKGKKKRKGKKH
jgi:hypothetical protein